MLPWGCLAACASVGTGTFFALAASAPLASAAAFSGLAELLPGLLKPGGHSLLEIGMGQESALGTLFKGLELLRIAPDLAGIPRCVILRKP